ncbi:DNA-binding protein [Leptothermofonsia sichuanensis E412]|uniref:DNA-binding protein n=1 Tax=Leptothermofonsia sichuanensis TaxID=2917832 RepID=UPI001CA6514B|nr:DNA-binding protein [Leptothermofonsia sichuanensis]QZZ21890.1 DNA-binding protein [Leptothermofonsia sichuanensis E412]
MRYSTLLALTLIPLTPVVYPPTAHAQMRIRDLQQTPPGITISGTVNQAIGNYFVLDDSSGQIIVDAGPRWWQPISLTPGERVTVRGKVGRSGELDAFSITRSDGTVINIRPDFGPPPWAGGSNRRGMPPGR